MSKKTIQRSIISAKGGNPTALAPIETKKKRIAIRKYEMPDVTQQVARIQEECDPVGFLMDVINGHPIECHYADSDGNITTINETASLKQRIDAAKYLGKIVVPSQSVHKHAHLHKAEDSWEQMVKHASNKSS